MNTNLITSFTKYVQMLREQKKSYFKIKNSNEILSGLLVYNVEIKTMDDAKIFIHSIGKKNPKSTLERIKTILEKGHLPEVKEYFEKTRNNEKHDSQTELASVYGVGPAKAKLLFENHGIKSVKQLKTMLKDNPEETKNLLTNSQLAGLIHYDDLRKRIPRKEITKYKKLLKERLKLVDPKAIMCIAGSNRRGQKTSGDIDILIKSTTLNMKSLTDLLKDITKVTLSEGKTKSMLLTSIDELPVRHMDLLITHPDQFAFAQLYFTGPKEFNIKMRAHALKRGYSLNEYRLKPTNSQIPKPGKLLTEKKIFQFLDYEFVKPTKR